MNTLAIRDSVIDGVKEQWDEKFESIVAGLRMPTADVVKLMLESIPSHVYDKQIGPFYNTTAVRKLLGNVTRQAISDRVKNHSLLRVTTADGVQLYPTFQFANCAIRPEIREILSVFRDAPVDGWAIAQWFTTPAHDLANRTPRAVLDEDPSLLEYVLPLAQGTAQRWMAP